MSTPRKHHYVPQVHIKKFEHQNGYSVFIKQENKIISKKLSNDIFAVKDLNSSLDEDGNIDHVSVEQTLADQWDSPFKSHFDILDSWISESIQQNDYSNISIEASLKFFFEYGLMGHLRSIRQNREFNDLTINSILEFEELIPDIDSIELSDSNFSNEQIEIGKSIIKNLINLSTDTANQWNEKLKFPAPSATELPMLVPEKLICDFFITSTPPFYLPDCTAIILKSEEETFKYKNQNINKIMSVGIPLTQHLFIQIRNKDFFPNDKTDLYLIEKERTDEINNQLIFHSFGQVLVSDNFKLNDIISN